MKSFDKFVVGYCLFICFGWAVTSSLDIFLILSGLLPSFILLFLLMRTAPKKQKLLVIACLGFFVLVNVTAEKNPLVFPIVSGGRLTYAKEFTFVHPDGGDKTAQCLSTNEYELKPGIPYPLVIEREIRHKDTIPLPYTDTQAFITASSSKGWGANFSVYPDMRDPYVKQCLRFDKPLVSGWANILNKLYIPFSASSYAFLPIYLVVNWLNRKSVLRQ